MTECVSTLTPTLVSEEKKKRLEQLVELYYVNAFDILHMILECRTTGITLAGHFECVAGAGWIITSNDNEAQQLCRGLDFYKFHCSSTFGLIDLDAKTYKMVDDLHQDLYDTFTKHAASITGPTPYYIFRHRLTRHGWCYIHPLSSKLTPYGEPHDDYAKQVYEGILASHAEYNSAFLTYINIYNETTHPSDFDSMINATNSLPNAKNSLIEQYKVLYEKYNQFVVQFCDKTRELLGVLESL